MNNVRVVYERKPRGGFEKLFNPDNEDKKQIMNGIKLVSVNLKKKMVIAIDKDEFIIGKKIGQVHVVIPDIKSISRVHCKISKSEGKYFIQDLKSTNGTFVNDKKLLPDVKIPIKVGDKIKISNVKFEVQEYKG